MDKRDKVRAAVEHLNNTLRDLAAEGVTVELQNVTCQVRLDKRVPGESDVQRQQYTGLRIQAWHEQER